MEDIQSLEGEYNRGSPFPTSLRELLFLAGEDCYVLDYGLSDSPAEMQQAVRRWLIRTNRSISGPFYAIDTYNGTGQFLFVYLNEGHEDPVVYEAVLYDSNDGISWIHSLDKTLSEYINYNVLKVLSGGNPF